MVAEDVEWKGQARSTWQQVMTLQAKLVQLLRLLYFNPSRQYRLFCFKVSLKFQAEKIIQLDN